MRTNTTHEPLLTADDIRGVVMHTEKGDIGFLAMGFAFQAFFVAFGTAWFLFWGYVSFNVDGTALKLVFGMFAGLAIIRTARFAVDLVRSLYHLFTSLAAKASQA